MRTVTLGKICHVTTGQSAPQESTAFGSSGTPFVRAGSLERLCGGDCEESLELVPSDQASKYRLKVFPKGTVVFAKSGMSAKLGRVYRLRCECHVVSHLAAVLPSDHVDSSYLHRWFEYSPPSRLIENDAYPSIKTSTLEKLKIPLPPLPEQRRIAAILDKTDALRAKRRETIAKLDQLLESVFLEMFGDPVANPKMWDPGTLGDVVEKMQYGPRFYNEAYSENGTRIVRITDLDATGKLNFYAMPRMDVTDEDLEKHALRPGDLIFARTGATVGKVALLKPSDPICVAGAYFIRLRFKGSVLPEYVFNALRSKSIQTLIAVKSRQAAQQNFSGPGLRELPMPVPPRDQQKRFVVIANEIEACRCKMQESVEPTDHIFSALQRQAFAGML